MNAMLNKLVDVDMQCGDDVAMLNKLVDDEE